jgi:hypothetical protein
MRFKSPGRTSPRRPGNVTAASYERDFAVLLRRPPEPDFFDELFDFDFALPLEPELFDFELDRDAMAKLDALDRGEAGRTGPNPDEFARV